MKTNTHDQNQINLTTTPSVAQVAKPVYDRILLGIDQHAADLRIVRQLDGAGTQPPQRLYPGSNLQQFIQKQLAQAKEVFAVYEAGPCGNSPLSILLDTDLGKSSFKNSMNKN